MKHYGTWVTTEHIETHPFTLNEAHDCLWQYFCGQFEEMWGDVPDLDYETEEAGTMRDYCIDSYDWQPEVFWEERDWGEDDTPNKWDLAYSCGVWLGHIEEETWDNWTPPRIVSTAT